MQRKWQNLNSNGLALSKDGRTLFVSQFLPAAVKAVNLVDGAVTLHAAVPVQRALAGPWMGWTSMARQSVCGGLPERVKSGARRRAVSCAVWRKA